MAPPPTTPTARTVVSFEELFDREAGYVHRTLLRLGVAGRDVEDGVQEVFLAAHRRWAQCDTTRPIRPWLFSFAFHHAANYRRLGRHREEPREHTETAAASDPERAYAEREARSIVLRALDALPDERRGVFVACEIDGFSAPEVAAQLGIPLGTVYSRLRAAREEFTLAVRRQTPERRAP